MFENAYLILISHTCLQMDAEYGLKLHND